MSLDIPKCVLAACIMIATAFVPVVHGQPTRVLKGASFRALGDLPGGEFRSDAVAVSRNGIVVAGWSRAPSSMPFRWTAPTGLVNLGASPNGGFGRAYDISDDGTAVVGRWTEPSGSNVPFRWTQSTGAVALSGIPAWVLNAYARTCSADGAVVAGWAGSTDDGASHAFLWTESTGMLDLLPPAGFPNGAEAKDMSSTGNIVVGSMFTDAYLYHGFRWTPTSGMVDLGFGAGIVQDVLVEAVSGDGNVVVGSGRLASGGQVAFRWTPAGGMQSIGELAGGAEFGRAYGVSGDGNVIVGQTSDSRGNQAFVWTPQLGMRPLQDYLVSVGVNLTGWTLFIAWDVSSDGRWIVGQGVNPDGNQEAFLASLPLTPTAAVAVALPRASLRSVGDLPGGARDSLAFAISAGGTHCSVGSDNGDGFGLGIYAGGTLTDCGWPTLPGANFVAGEDIAVVAGSPTVVGFIQDDLGSQYAFKWSAAGGYQMLPGPAGQTDYSYAIGISDDGHVVVGASPDPGSGFAGACAWTDGVPTFLADLPGGFPQGFALACNASGLIIVGYASGFLSSDFEPTVWNQSSGTVSSIGLASGFTRGSANAVSADGLVAAGTFDDGNWQTGTSKAFRWSSGSGIQLLDPPLGWPSSSAHSVSGDGAVIVGSAFDRATGTYEACLWSPGPVKIRDLLQARGAIVTGWQLHQATGVSRNGRFICGTGFNELTQSYEGWVADLGID